MHANKKFDVATFCCFILFYSDPSLFILFYSDPSILFSECPRPRSSFCSACRIDCKRTGLQRYCSFLRRSLVLRCLIGLMMTHMTRAHCVRSNFHSSAAATTAGMVCFLPIATRPMLLVACSLTHDTLLVVFCYRLDCIWADCVAASAALCARARNHRFLASKFATKESATIAFSSSSPWSRLNPRASSALPHRAPLLLFLSCVMRHCELLLIVYVSILRRATILS